MTGNVFQIALAKGSQRFVFRYGSGQESAVANAISNLASDPDSGLNWFDAAVLCFKLTRRLDRQARRAQARRAG